MFSGKAFALALGEQLIKSGFNKHLLATSGIIT